MENKKIQDVLKPNIKIGEKYNVQKGIVDLKPTQIKLLKVLKKLDNNLESNNYPKKREDLEKMYSEIFDELQVIVNFIKQLKQNKIIEVNDDFLKKADVITRILNDRTDENYRFVIPKNIPIVDAVKLKPMVFDDSFLNDDIIKKGKTDISGTHQNTLTIDLDNSKVIDISSISKGKDLIAANNKNTFTIKFTDIDTQDSLIPVTRESITRNHGNTLTIELPEADIGIETLNKGRQSIDLNNQNTLAINFAKSQNTDDGFLAAVRTNIDQNNDTDFFTQLPETPSSDTSIIEKGKRILSEASAVKSPEFAKDPYYDTDLTGYRTGLVKNMNEATQYISSKKELLADTTEDLSTFGQKMEEIDEATVIVSSLINVITNILNPATIKNLVSREVKIIHKSETIFDKSTFKVDSRSAALDLPEIVKIFDIDRAKIKGIDIDLDNDPVLTGGNLDAYRRKLFEPKKDKKTLIKQIKLNLEELKNQINRFNVLFIQYNYFINFLINKMKQLQTLEEHDIYVVLNMKEVNDYLEILKRKYTIITNPEAIFKPDINTPSKSKDKILYFKHYYFIYILYNLFDDINTLAKGNGFENNSDYIINLLNEEKSTEEAKIEISKYFMIFNLYSDLIKD